MRFVCLAVLMAAVVAAVVAGCTGSILQGTIEGTVTDDGGNPVDAAVVIVLRGGAEIARAITHNGGHYRVTSLDPGTYDVYATATGFTDSAVARVVVLQGNPATRNLILGT
jgi:hypothetical protein